MLRDLRWQKRLLLVFSPDGDDKDLRRQQDILADADLDLDERQVVAITVTLDTVSTRGRPPFLGSASDIRVAFGVDPQDFEVLLVGKDGGVKLRQREPVAVSALIARIDAMPMRRREMQQKL